MDKDPAVYKLFGNPDKTMAADLCVVCEPNDEFEENSDTDDDLREEDLIYSTKNFDEDEEK